jgi:hypothetical protein
MAWARYAGSYRARGYGKPRGARTGSRVAEETSPLAMEIDAPATDT